VASGRKIRQCKMDRTFRKTADRDGVNNLIAATGVGEERFERTKL